MPSVVGLAAAYGFDEGTGTTLNDLSGNGNTGTITGATWNPVGRFGKALSFNGANNWASVSNSASLNLTTALTLEAWVRFNALPANVDQRIISKASDSSEQGHYWMLGQTGNRLRFRLKTGGITTTLIASTGNLVVGTWYHAAAVYDGTTMRLYLNGAEVGSTAKTGAVNTSATVPVNIGRNPDGSNYFSGLIDEARIYSRALSQTEIQNDMATAVSTSPQAVPATMTSITSKITSEMQATQPIESENATNEAAFSKSKNMVLALSCLPNTVKAGAEVGCELRVSKNSAPLAIQLASSSENVKLPELIATRPNQSRLTFQVFVEPGAKQQSAVITATLDDSQVQDKILVTASAGPVLTVPDAQIAKIGAPVSFSISAVDPADLPVQLEIARLPDGASFDAVSGRFSWIPNASQAGKHQITFTAYNSSRQSSTGNVVIEVDSGRPVVTPSKEFSCSPNAIASLTGKWLAVPGSVLSDPSGRAMDLGGVKVKINGHYVPVLFSSVTQVNFLCPDLNPGTELSVEIETSSGTTEPLSTIMREVSPAILSVDGSGKNQGVVFFADAPDLVMARNFQMPGHPAQPGDRIVIWATGLASIADASTGRVLVKIGDIHADIESIQAAPGYAGLYNILVRAPAASTFGDDVPVQLQVTALSGQEFDSNTVTVSIEQEGK